MTVERVPPSTNRPVLSEERIVEAALKVLKRDGLEPLTMRSLAAELDVTQMAAYYYVKSKTDLLNLVADAVFAQIEIPTSDEGTWDIRLRLLCHREFAAVRPYKGLSGFLSEAKLGPGQLRLFKAQLGIFQDAGIDEVNVMRAFAMVHTYMIGRFVLADRLSGPGRRRMVNFLGKRAAADAGSVLVDFALDTMIAGLQALTSDQNTTD